MQIINVPCHHGHCLLKVGLKFDLLLHVNFEWSWKQEGSGWGFIQNRELWVKIPNKIIGFFIIKKKEDWAKN